MKHYTWDKLFTMLDGGWAWSIDQEMSIFRVVDVEFVQVCLEILSQLFHSGHISVENWFYNSFPDETAVFHGKFTAKEVIFVDIELSYSGGSMEIFLDVLVTIHLVDRRPYDYMVSVIVTIMLDIMAKCSHDQGKCV